MGNVIPVEPWWLKTYNSVLFVEEEYKHELIDTYPNINTIMTQINIDTKEDIQNSEEVRIYGEVG